MLVLLLSLYCIDLFSCIAASVFTINLLTYSLRLHPLAIFVAISVCVCVADAAEYKSVPSTAVNCEVDVSYRYQQTAAVNNVPPATHVIPATVLRPEVIPCSAVIHCESKKVAPPLKLFAIFSLRLGIFP